VTYDSTLHAISGLVGHWRLNEASGTTAVDDVNGNDGTLAGAGVLVGQAGLLLDDPTDGSFDFPGTAGYVTIPHHASYPTTGAFSLLIWTKLDITSLPDTPVFGRLAAGPVRGYALYVGTDPAHGAAVDLFHLVTQEAVNGATWLHGPRPAQEITYFLVGTYDGVSTTKLYANGRLYAQGTVPAAPGSNTDDLTITTHGLAGDAALFDRALSAAEVESLYEAGAGECTRRWYGAGYSSTSLGIVAAWPADEASGTVLRDGANGHAGIAATSRTAHNATVVAPGGMHLPAQTRVACDGGTAWKLNTADIGSFPFTRFLVPNHAALEPTNLSLVAWVSPQRWPVGIMEKSDGADTGYGLGIDSSGRPYVWVGDGGGADVCLADAADTVPVDGRILLVGTYEAATTTLKLYRQHSLVKTLVGTNGLAHSGDLYLGYDHRASGVALERYFGGRFDKLALYNTVLSAADVLELWRACKCVGQRSRSYLLA
jgi:hypothetical protein